MDTTLLASLANTQIANCVANNSQVVGSGEVAEVARLVLGLPDRLVTAWQPHLAGGSIVVEGVFCHATPQACWKDPFSNGAPQRKPGGKPPKVKKRRPELCDLLIVMENSGLKGVPTKRAALIQAKLGTDQLMNVGTGSPAVQRYMYANWPPFTLRGRPFSPLQNVNIRPIPNGSCQGSRYACVDEITGRWDVEAQQAAATGAHKSFNDYAGWFKANVSLGESLTNMLGGTFGAECRGEWGRLVQHLQRLAVARLFESRRPAGVRSAVPARVLPHAARAAAFVNHAQALLPGIPEMDWHHLLGWNDRDSRTTLPEGERIRPGRGFGVLTIRVGNIEVGRE